jgi:CubicO group peptidase (beta-lactamase class C family)
MVVIALLLTLGSACVSVQTPSVDSWNFENIRQKYKLPGLAAVVTKDGAIIEQDFCGFRKVGDNATIALNDQFHIGSCTKSMTATLTAMLIEDGKLRWDSTIAEVFPEMADLMNPAYRSVTVEQLLQHRGGVPTKPPAEAWNTAWKEIGTPTQQRTTFIKSVLAAPPEARPGTKMIYSNQGYAIVGAMLEKITRTPFETLMTNRLFKPLHMNSAGFGFPGTAGKADQPWGHVVKGSSVEPIQSDNPPAITPAGRVHCSLDDLARYTMFHMADRSASLLKPETLARLHTAPEGSDYACGWVVAERGWAGGTALTHAGSNTMWYVVMWLAPKKDFSVVVGTNIASDEAAKATDEAAAMLIRRLVSRN